MASKKFWLGMLVMVLAFGMTVLGCDAISLKTDAYSYSFVNNSSYNITITCSELNPSSFTVNSGQTKTATSSESKVNIQYNYADSIKVTASPGTFTFTNK